NPAVLEVQLHQAERTLAALVARHQAGIGSQLDLDAAARRGDLLKARLANDRVQFAQVKVKYAERAATLLRSRRAVGVATNADLQAAEDTLAVERIRLEAAQKRAAAAP